jgi:hypothetical protein
MGDCRSHLQNRKIAQDRTAWPKNGVLGLNFANPTSCFLIWAVRVKGGMSDFHASRNHGINLAASKRLPRPKLCELAAILCIRDLTRKNPRNHPWALKTTSEAKTLQT